ncbi:hypothetical protein KKH36_02665 [Patescibacteria group bacterium]|nr:hypothetical protein [Patescibacteria group bacterium]
MILEKVINTYVPKKQQRREKMDIQKFTSKFKFDPTNTFKVGIERETFLTNLTGEIVPINPQVLNFFGITDQSREFGYELSACQLEERIGPVRIEKVKEHLLRNSEKLDTAEKILCFRREYLEVAPEDMPLDVFPDPTGRYQKITKDMPVDILRAACRVAATHFHIGMPNIETTLKVYNYVINHVDRLCRIGDNSNGERLKIYKVMAPDFSPPRYNNWESFYQEALNKGFDEDPRKCWHFIRISIHGTIEFRMFGNTADIQKVAKWAEICHCLCLMAVDDY